LVAFLAICFFALVLVAETIGRILYLAGARLATVAVPPAGRLTRYVNI